MSFKLKLLQVLKESYERKSFIHFYNCFKIFFFSFFKLKSLKSAVNEQNLDMRFLQVEQIVKNHSDHYNSVKIEGEYWEYKVKALHAFQLDFGIECIKKVKETLKNKDEITIVDIGDSSGNHITYFKEIIKDINLKTLSVNIDPSAVEKIKKKGLNAINSRAEDIEKHNINPDIFISFQTIEHLNSPITFMRSIAQKTSCNFYLITVPYVSTSRLGLEHIRGKFDNSIIAENIHIFELCPDDWKLLFKHSGWEPVREKIFWQYPKKKPLRLLKNSWARYDFEGFYGILLKKNSYWSDKYLDW